MITIANFATVQRLAPAIIVKAVENTVVEAILLLESWNVSISLSTDDAPYNQLRIAL